MNENLKKVSHKVCSYVIFCCMPLADICLCLKLTYSYTLMQVQDGTLVDDLSTSVSGLASKVSS
jgi:hypothetical protein